MTTTGSVDLGCNTEELLAVLMSRDIRDWDTAACGTLSQLPASAMLLAEATHAPNIEIIIRGSEAYGQHIGRDMHFLAQRGKMDVFFLSAIQFDAEGNFNLHVIGDPDAPDRRMPGGYGSGMLAYTAKRIIFFRTEHSRRAFVPKVDFVSGAMKTEGKIKRNQESARLFTPMAILSFDRAEGHYALDSVHPGFTVDDVRENTGFELAIPEDVPETAAPTAEELHTLRTEVRDRMIETDTYADWARRTFQPA